MALSPTTRAAYERLAGGLAARHAAGARLVGISGAQGSGKSTLAAVLTDTLAHAHGLSAVAVSLDDFYLGRAARAALATSVHPLLATRGVPGTHDVARGIEALTALKRGESVRLPRFSKAEDDALPAAKDRPAGPADLVLFEGWCVGTPPQDEIALAEPVNALEREEDGDGRWRRHVNAQLAGPYAEWFGLLDALVFLQVPGWAQVREWRGQQERETAAAHGGRSALLDESVRERFLQHYQRLTAHALSVMPARAELIVRIDENHTAASLVPAMP